MRHSDLVSICLAAALSLLPGVGMAQDEEEEQAPPPDIACPAGPITSGVTTQLPREWRREPESGELVSTSVRNREGRFTLICTYDNVGNLTLAMPERFESCTPAERGFTCVRRTRESPFASRGRIRLTPGRGADLDSGEVVTALGESDIAFAGFGGLLGQGAPSAILESFNHTRFAAAPSARARPQDCRRADYRTTRITVGADFARGKPVCYRTNQNRFGLLTLDTVDGFTVRLRHRTLRQ